MSPAAAALASGRDTLLGTHGEPLQFRVGEAGETTVTGVVYRNAEEDREDMTNFTDRDFSRIRIAPMTPEPQAGEVFIDEDGRYHRIVKTRNVARIWFMCWCEIAAAA